MGCPAGMFALLTESMYVCQEFLDLPQQRVVLACDAIFEGGWEGGLSIADAAQVLSHIYPNHGEIGVSVRSSHAPCRGGTRLPCRGKRCCCCD